MIYAICFFAGNIGAAILIITAAHLSWRFEESKRVREEEYGYDRDFYDEDD